MVFLLYIKMIRYILLLCCAGHGGGRSPSDPCSPCPPGSWSSGRDTQPCVPCGFGYTSPEAATCPEECYPINACPAGTQYPAFSGAPVSIEQCVCKPGGLSAAPCPSCSSVPFLAQHSCWLPQLDCLSRTPATDSGCSTTPMLLSPFTCFNPLGFCVMFLLLPQASAAVPARASAHCALPAPLLRAAAWRIASPAPLDSPAPLEPAASTNASLLCSHARLASGHQSEQFLQPTVAATADLEVSHMLLGFSGGVVTHLQRFFGSMLCTHAML